MGLFILVVVFISSCMLIWAAGTGSAPSKMPSPIRLFLIALLVMAIGVLLVHGNSGGA